MAPTQFYITGLFNGVTTEELQSILNPYGTVQNIDIKIKTNTQGDDFRTFAIVDIDANEKNLTKCFSNYNNTLWKGRRMKLSKTKATTLNKSEINPANDDYSSTHKKKLTSEEHKIFSPNEVPMSDKRLSMFSKYKDHKYQSTSCNIDNDEKETSNQEEIDDLGPVCEGVPMFKGISAMQSVLHKNANISTSLFDGIAERHLRKAQIVVDKKSKTLGFQTSTPKSPEKIHFNNVKVNYSKEHSLNKMHHSDFQSHSHKENSVLSRLEGFSSIWRDGEGNENGVIDFDVDYHCNQLADVDYHSDSSTNSYSGSKKCNKDVSMQPVKEFLKIRKKASDFFDKNYSSDHASEKLEEHKRDDGKSKKEKLEIKKAIPNKNDLPLDYVSQQDVLKVKQISKEKKRKSKSVEMKLQDNEKRMRSIKEKQSELKSKQKVIQHALASVDSNQTSNKKIVFDSEDENEDNVSGKINQKFSKEKSLMEASFENHAESTSQKKPQLFDEDDDEFFPENLDAVFKDKKQFEGTSGRKLLELQSAFGADERFKLDERFMNNTGDFEDEDMPEKDNDNNSMEEFTEETDLKQENLRSLDILRNVIDLSSSMVEDLKKRKKQIIPEMIRYDERNPEHSVYVAPEKKVPLTSLEPSEKNEPSIPVVSQECFFEVDPSLESALQTDKANKKESFSLLNVFSSMRNDDEEKNYLKEQIYTPKTITTKIKNPLVYDSSDAEEESENLNKKAKGLRKTEMISGLTNQTFFFFPNDLRLQDGIKFFTRKEELHVDYKNWIDIRETLKQNIKMQAKNTTKDRWKKKRRFQTNTFKDRKK